MASGSPPCATTLASGLEYPELFLTSPVTAIKNGGYGVKPGEFEVTGRAASNKRTILFARYVGGES